MLKDPWLPSGFNLPNKNKTKRILFEGDDWQIYSLMKGDSVLIAKEELGDRWLAAKLLPETLLVSFAFGKHQYWAFTSKDSHHLLPLTACKSPNNKTEAISFAHAMKETRKIEQDANLGDAIYAEQVSRLLPVWTLSAKVEDEIVMGRWLTGGVPVSTRSFRRLACIMEWMGQKNLCQVLETAGFIVPKDGQPLCTEEKQKKLGSDSGKKNFTLIGRPRLEEFFRDHVIDIIENAENYKALGIDFPSAIAFHGPPGCGKTFAVERLVDCLGWPIFSIDSSSIGSPYIHETGKKIAEVFDKAMENAPAVIVIDEMEAFLSDRASGAGSGLHHVEEVAEFLRRIPEAIGNHVLIIGMTNCIDMIDPAILRRGRFDHVIEVGLASETEIQSLVEMLLGELPCDHDIKEQSMAKLLSGRPLSDVTFVIRESARLAAKAGKKMISNVDLLSAIDLLPPIDDKVSEKIGFL